MDSHGLVGAPGSGSHDFNGDDLTRLCAGSVLSPNTPLSFTRERAFAGCREDLCRGTAHLFLDSP